VIIVRGGRGKLLLASGAGPLFGRGNPPGAMPTPDVDNEIGLHLASVVTAGTIPDSGALGGMGLHHVLLEPGLLDKGLAASRFGTNVVEDTGVLLHVIEHSVLALLDDSTIRADKGTGLVPQISHFDGRCHPDHCTLLVTCIKFLPLAFAGQRRTLCPEEN